MTQDALPPPMAQRDDTTDRVISAIGYVLLFISIFSFHLGGVIAVVLAYVRRGSAPPLEASHYGFQIRIFWWAFILSILSVVLFCFVVGAGISAGIASAIADIWAIHWGIGAGIAAIGMAACFIAAVAWLIIGSLIGFIKLMSNQPA